MFMQKSETMQEKKFLCEKVMEKIIGIANNPELREDESVWAKLFLEWDFLDVQTNTEFAGSLKKYCEEQIDIPNVLWNELMIVYGLELSECQGDETTLVDLEPFKENGFEAFYIIASLWNEQQEDKRDYIWHMYLRTHKSIYRQNYYKNFQFLRFLFINGIQTESQKELCEEILSHGKPEYNFAGQEDAREYENHLPYLFAYLVNRYEIPDDILDYFYREYELYFLDGSIWEEWYAPLRDEILKRYPALEDIQFKRLSEERGYQNLSKEEQRMLMKMINPFLTYPALGQKKAYQELMKMLNNKQEEEDYSYHFYLLAYCVEKMNKGKIKNSGLNFTVQLVTYIKSYLFALPLMEYPEKVRSSFLKNLWQFYYYFERNERRQKFEFEGLEELLLHCESTRIPAVFAVWDLDCMPESICSHCGKTLSPLSFEEGKNKTVKREIVEEWDVYGAAKNLLKKSKSFFDIYKKVSKLYRYRTCEQCGADETFLDAYMNWWYENTPWKRPDRELLEWLYKEIQQIPEGFDESRQKKQYCKFLMDYLYESKDWDRKCVTEYFRAMQNCYHFFEEKKERSYYLEKTKNMLEIVLQEEELSKEESEHFSVLRADIIFDGLKSNHQPYEEVKREWDYVIEVYDSLLGKGNMKSIAVYEKMAYSLAYNQNHIYDPEQSIQIYTKLLLFLQDSHPDEKERIARIKETVAFIYRDKLKDYAAAIPYYEEYLSFIEETYGKESEYAHDEKRVWKELCEMAKKKPDHE